MDVPHGKYVELTAEEMTSHVKYILENGETLNIVNTIDILVDLEFESHTIKSQN